MEKAKDKLLESSVSKNITKVLQEYILIMSMKYSKDKWRLYLKEFTKQSYDRNIFIFRKVSLLGCPSLRSSISFISKSIRKVHPNFCKYFTAMQRACPRNWKRNWSFNLIVRYGMKSLLNCSSKCYVLKQKYNRKNFFGWRKFSRSIFHSEIYNQIESSKRRRGLVLEKSLFKRTWVAFYFF